MMPFGAASSWRLGLRQYSILKAARDRKRLVNGKCEGRKSHAELNPDLAREAKRLRRRSPKGHQRSLRDVAAELAKLGFVNQRGAEFSASSVQSMLALLIRLRVQRASCATSRANQLERQFCVDEHESGDVWGVGASD